MASVLATSASNSCGLSSTYAMRREQRVRLEARRVDGERLVERLARFVVLARRRSPARRGRRCASTDDGLISSARLASVDRLRRVVVGERARGADERRRPARIDLQRHLERLQRLARCCISRGTARPTPVWIGGIVGQRRRPPRDTRRWLPGSVRARAARGRRARLRTDRRWCRRAARPARASPPRRAGRASAAAGRARAPLRSPARATRPAAAALRRRA